MRKKTLLLGFISLLAWASCLDSREQKVTTALQYQAYCGSCHAVPDPSNLPKSIWEEYVLPEMAVKMGFNQASPLDILAMEKEVYANEDNASVFKSGIDSATWQQIHDYILSQAPDSIPVDGRRANRNLGLTQFQATPLFLDEHQAGGITHIGFERGDDQFVIGDSYGKLYTWPESADKSLRFQSPVISSQQKEGEVYVTEIGYMAPGEQTLGAVYRMGSETRDTLVRGLRRPVYTQVADLNEEGEAEILICEFGDQHGELSMLVSTAGKYEKRTLLPVPGTIKVEIEDMNHDGKKDIVVLASQGNEGIYFLYQENNLQFKAKQVIELGPEYGSSWFELIDYNGDGHLDIVLANGDNADYSVFLKPFHGLRLFMNDGNDGFEETWFYPIYGATRVLTEDYDLDGDLDFAVMAFFPDFGTPHDESFVFLENVDPGQYRFQAHTCEASSLGRWLVMEKGDVDEDGDMDIMLGSFLLPLAKEHDDIMDRWRDEKINLLFLENQVK